MAVNLGDGVQSEGVPVGVPNSDVFRALLHQLHAAHTQEVAVLHTELARARRESASATTSNIAPTRAADGAPGHSDDVEPPQSNDILANDQETKKASPPASLNKLGSGLARIRVQEMTALDWSHPLAFVTSVVKNQWFDLFTCCIIFANALFMAVQVQYYGAEVGWVLGYPGYERKVATEIPNAEAWMDAVAMTFGAIFAFELVIKVIGLRREFISDFWCWIDFTLVAFWFVGHVARVEYFAKAQAVRLARLGRLLRFLKLVRRIQSFDSLFIMTTAVQGSAHMLLWTLIFLSLTQMMISLALNQYLLNFYFNDCPSSREQCRAMFTYFGTFTRTFFSVFELTLANWPPAVRLLAQNVSEWFFVFGVLHKLSMGFAVVGVINGFFMSETLKVAALDDSLMVRQRARAAKMHAEKMRRLFEEADKQSKDGTRMGDGSISREEFHALLSDREIRYWLQSMDLDVSDYNTLFDLIDVSHDGSLDIDELVHGVGKLKGPARSVDMKDLLRRQVALEDTLKQMVGRNELRLVDYHEVV